MIEKLCLILLLVTVSTAVFARERSFTLTGIRMQQPARNGQNAFAAEARSGTITTGKITQVMAEDVTVTTLDKEQHASLVVTAATLSGGSGHARLGGPLQFGWQGGHGTAAKGFWHDNQLDLEQISLLGDGWRIDAPSGSLFDLNQPSPYARLVSGVQAWFAPSLLP